MLRASKNITLECKADSRLSLRSITYRDLERLRAWKNANCNMFFFKEHITFNCQKTWFDSYTMREEDYMFIVYLKETPVGCMGFRKESSNIDLYNIIAGTCPKPEIGIMSISLRMMCSYAYDLYGLPLTGKILNENRAIKWFFRSIALYPISKTKSYLDMKIDLDKFRPVEYLLVSDKSSPQ